MASVKAFEQSLSELLEQVRLDVVEKYISTLQELQDENDRLRNRLAHADASGVSDAERSEFNDDRIGADGGHDWEGGRNKWDDMAAPSADQKHEEKRRVPPAPPPPLRGQASPGGGKTEQSTHGAKNDGGGVGEREPLPRQKPNERRSRDPLPRQQKASDARPGGSARDKEERDVRETRAPHVNRDASRDGQDPWRRDSDKKTTGAGERRGSERSRSRDRSIPRPVARARGGGVEPSANKNRSGGELCFPYVIGKCKRDNACPMRHPVPEECENIIAVSRKTQCRFGSACTREECIFAHEGR